MDLFSRIKKFISIVEINLQRRAKSILIIAFLLMIIVRGVFIIYEGNDYKYIITDEAKYVSYARHLINEGKFVMDNGIRAWAPPAYPAALGLSFLAFGEQNLMMARLQQLAFDCITFWLIFIIGFMLRGNACGVLGSLGFILHPENISLLGRSMLLTENLYVLLFILFISLFFYRLKYVGRGNTFLTIAVGAVSGISILVRPILIGLPLVLIFVWFLTKIFSRNILSLKDILILIVIFGIFPSAWMVRNYNVLNGHAILTSHSGLILFSATNPDIDGGYTPGKKLAKEIIKLTPETEGQYAKELTILGMQNITKYKWRWVNLALKNISRLWINLPKKELTTTRWLYIVYIPIFLSLLALAIIGLLKNMDSNIGVTMGLFVVLLFVYYSALHSVCNASIRYSVPFLPILMIYASIGLFPPHNLKEYKSQSMC